MQPVKRTLMGIGIMALCFGLTLDAWGGGGTNTPACLLPSGPGQGATAVRGTVALEVVNVSVQTQTVDIDFLLRLAQGGNQAQFRIHFLTPDFFAVTIEQVVCMLVDPLEWATGPPEQTAVSQLVTDILQQLKLPPGRKLVITDKSITGNEIENSSMIDLIGIDRGTPPLPERAFTMFDVTYYAVR